MIEAKCEVCKDRVSKYKCPVCVIKFCCVACFKSHKESGGCVKPVVQEPSHDKSEQNSVPEYEFETEDTVKPEKLLLLEKDYRLRKSLENRHLRKMIKHLNSSKSPAEGMEQAMKEPIFVEFVEHCLRVVEGDQYSSDDSDDDSS